jgi:hypothetical protein
MISKSGQYGGTYAPVGAGLQRLQPVPYRITVHGFFHIFATEKNLTQYE